MVHSSAVPVEPAADTVAAVAPVVEIAAVAEMLAVDPAAFRSSVAGSPADHTNMPEAVPEFLLLKDFLILQLVW